MEAGIKKKGRKARRKKSRSKLQLIHFLQILPFAISLERNTEAYSEPFQTSKLEHFAKIVAFSR